MINVSIDVSELKAFAQNLPQVKNQIFDLMNLDLKSINTEYMSALLNVELSLFLGRDRYERKTSISTTSTSIDKRHFS